MTTANGGPVIRFETADEVREYVGGNVFDEAAKAWFRRLPRESQLGAIADHLSELAESHADRTLTLEDALG